MTNPIDPIEKQEFKNIPSEVITKLLMVSRRLAESSELSEVLSTARIPTERSSPTRLLLLDSGRFRPCTEPKPVLHRDGDSLPMFPAAPRTCALPGCDDLVRYVIAAKQAHRK